MLDKGQEELIERIMEELNECEKRNLNFIECYKKAVKYVLTDFVIVESTRINYCQSCGKDFNNGDLVHYAAIDNNIVCSKCSEVHIQKELRVVQR